MFYSILSIGTELTSGQILNRNATWISQKMSSRGLVCAEHVVVPDNHQMILDALHFCARNSQILFITGGLGPTTDDFTRDVVAEWAHVKMQFDQASFDHIKDRLSQRGMPTTDSQKQQCYFPEGARILSNSQGTANGFTFNKDAIKVYVLPGPPKEIEAIWQDHIETELDKLTSHLEKWMTLSWDCMGAGESHIAELTEAALKNYNFEKGYRVHQPYVEVKLTFKKSNLAQGQEAAAQVETALSEYIVCRNGDDLAELFMQKAKHYKRIYICDQFDKNILSRRLHSAQPEDLHNLQFFSKAFTPELYTSEVLLSLQQLDPYSAKVSIEMNKQKYTSYLNSQFRVATLAVRAQQQLVEKALQFWLEYL